MKNTLILTMLAAAFLGSGVANAARTLYASDYTGDSIELGTDNTYAYNTLVVDTPLTLTGKWGYLDLYNGAIIQFQKEQAAEAICSIFPSEVQTMKPVYFADDGDVYNFTFDAGAQELIAASAGSPITLIQDLNKESGGFKFFNTTPAGTTLKLNGVGYNETVELDGVSFTYVGPQEDTYTFKAGEIGFTGYYTGSHNLSLVAKAPAPVPEPTTGTLSLLALAGLCARRRRK